MENFQYSKNVIYKSKVYATGNVHIGDIYIINGIQRKIPLQLNTIPFIDKADVIGRDNDLQKINISFMYFLRVLFLVAFAYFPVGVFFFNCCTC